MNKRVITELVILIVLAWGYAGAQVAINQGLAPPFLDSNVLVSGSSDTTKGFRFEADTNITTGTTRVYTVPDANGSLIIDSGAGLVPTYGQVTIGRMLVSGFTPTCSSTGATSAAIATGSTDYAGACELTGDGANATGTMTLTFSTSSGAYGTSAGFCDVTLAKGVGGTVDVWSGVTASVMQTTNSTTAPTFTWNNTVALTINKTYRINYICTGR